MEAPLKRILGALTQAGRSSLLAFGGQDPLYQLGDTIVYSLVVASALYTVIYHGAVVLGLSLLFVTFAFFGVSLIFLVAYLPWRKRTLGGALGPRGLQEALALAGLAVVCALLALLTHRPDADDVSYLSRAVHNAEHFGEAMLLGRPFAYLSVVYPPESLRSFEHLAASMAWVVGVRPVEIYHFLFPVVGGALTPLVWFLLLRRFASSRAAALMGTLAIVLLLCADGTTHRSLGNFSLVRIWQGKVVLMALLTPVCVGYLVDALIKPSLTAYLRLVALAIAGFGMNVMALFYLPLLGGAAGLAFFLVERGRVRFSSLALSGLALVLYTLLGGVPVYLKMKTLLPQSEDEAYWPADLPSILSYVFGWPPGLAVTVGLASLMLLLALRRGRLAGWLILWTALILVPLAIPGLSPWVADHLTSRNAFWRVLYTLPLPLVVGLAAMELHAFGHRRPWIMGALAAVAVAAVVSLALWEGSVSPWGAKEVTFPRLELKRPVEELSWSWEIIRKLDPGPMAAELEISHTLPLLTSTFPQADLRAGFWANKLHELYDGKIPLGKRRIQLVNRLKHYRYVVAEREVGESFEAKRFLREAGFQLREEIGAGYLVFARER